MQEVLSTYIIAEMSANHNGDYQKAVDILHAAKESGADAIKLQTYTADTMTLDCDNEYFKVKGGLLWDGYSLHKLYSEAMTPWEWQPRLKEIADKIGIELFSTPFDPSSVDFLEKMNVEKYKIASFEIVDIPLLERIAETGKAVIMSTGMASVEEIDLAIKTLRNGGCPEVALLKCTSAYPATPKDMNLLTIPDMARTFDCRVGLSDHSMGNETVVAAIALGASIVEKHFCLSRNDKGPDSAFSLEPHEFREMSKQVRATEKALGRVNYGPTESENKTIIFRKSLWVAEDIKNGETLTTENIRCLRPGNGLEPKHYKTILGQKATGDLKKGTPLNWDHIMPPEKNS